MKTVYKIIVVGALLSSIALVPINIYNNDNSEALAWFLLSLGNLASVLDAFGFMKQIGVSVEVEKKEQE